MIIIQPRVEVDAFDSAKILRDIEFRGRRSYKSEDKITPDSAQRFVKMLISRGHESVLEHEKLSVCFVIDRGISHELVRHRIASYTQESTRYVNYGKGSDGITVIEPWLFMGGRGSESLKYQIWYDSCKVAEQAYLNLLALGISPQWARAVLPQSLKTEVETTFNFREWRHFFRLRCAEDAHPQMRQVAIPLLLHLKQRLPDLFEDIPYDVNLPITCYAEIVVRPEA